MIPPSIPRSLPELIIISSISYFTPHISYFPSPRVCSRAHEEETVMRHRIWLLVTVAALLPGCRPEMSNERPHIDIRGRVTGVIVASGEMRDRKIEGFVRVEGIREPDTGYDKAAITITDSTTIRLHEAGEIRPADFSAIRDGDSVEAEFTGPVRESYPVQVTARWITIIARSP